VDVAALRRIHGHNEQANHGDRAGRQLHESHTKTSAREKGKAGTSDVRACGRVSCGFVSVLCAYKIGSCDATVENVNGNVAAIQLFACLLRGGPSRHLHPYSALKPIG
jgi:hypothetical protein